MRKRSEFLPKNLDTLALFCDLRQLTVNLGKSKVMIFNRSKKLLKDVHFFFRGEEIKVTSTYKAIPIWQTGLKLLEGDVTSQLARVSLKVLPLHCIRSETIQNCISLVSSAYTVYSGLLEDVSNAVQLGEDVQFPSKRLAKVFLKFAFFCDELLSSKKYAQWGSEVQSRIKATRKVMAIERWRKLSQRQVLHIF